MTTSARKTMLITITILVAIAVTLLAYQVIAPALASRQQRAEAGRELKAMCADLHRNGGHSSLCKQNAH